MFNKVFPNLFKLTQKYYTRIGKFMPGKWLFGEKLTLADFLIGKIYTDYFGNPACPHRDLLDELLKKNPEFEAYGK